MDYKADICSIGFGAGFVTIHASFHREYVYFIKIFGHHDLSDWVKIGNMSDGSSFVLGNVVISLKSASISIRNHGAPDCFTMFIPYESAIKLFKISIGN